MDLFEIVGPVMVGPSSSHTAGAARIGRLCRLILGEPVREVDILLHGSFAETYRGHGTDRALAGGLLNMKPSDPRLPDALELAKAEGVNITIRTGTIKGAHPNTALLRTSGTSRAVEVLGSSVGGGRILVTQVDGFPVELNGSAPALMVEHADRPGVVAAVAAILAASAVNIAAFRVGRKARGGRALAVAELDSDLPAGALAAVQTLPAVGWASLVPALD